MEDDPISEMDSDVLDSNIADVALDDATDEGDDDSEAFVEDAAPQPQSGLSAAWAFLRVLGHSFGAMVDIAMMIVGMGLVAIAVATLLDGFGLAELDLTDTSGAMFGSALLVGVFGSFALGVANEGPLTSPRPGPAVDLVVTTIFRALSIVVVAFGLGWAAVRLPDLLSSLPQPFTVGITVIEQTGRAGTFFALFLGMPVAVVLRIWKSELREDVDFAVIFLAWLLGTVLFVSNAL